MPDRQWPSTGGERPAGRRLTVVVLAAGAGTRMRSNVPKVLHSICGQTLLGHVLAAVHGLPGARTAVVVGAGREQVLPTLPATVRPVVQPEPGGTGQAVRLAIESLAAAPDAGGLTAEDLLLVVPGDTPLLTTATLARVIAAADARTAAMLTAELDDPTGYGRVLREATGQVRAVVEERDADAATRAVSEVATSVYAFPLTALAAALRRVTTDNAQREEYLTDAVTLLRQDGVPTVAVPATDRSEVLGVNDRVQLAAARRALWDRLLHRAMLAGVTVVDPASTYLGVAVSLEPDSVIFQNTQLHGTTLVESGAEVGPNVTLRDTAVRAGARVRDAVCEGAEIGPGAVVGPYTYLRPGTVLGAGAKAGAYVEIKASTVGEGSKVPHLSYVGDARIGRRSNIGAATVFVNYDGTAKHPTEVGDDVRVGSDTMLVAPVRIGDGAYTAAGSVITSDVPAGALGIGRARQRNVEGWVARRRGGPTAGASEGTPS